jgi:uncharacterized protein YbaR (Trm112 family)
MIDPALLQAVRCPETHQPLTLADPELLRCLNEKIRMGEVFNRGRQPIIEPLEDGLVRTDGNYIYPVQNGIVVLLRDSAIPLLGS